MEDKERRETSPKRAAATQNKNFAPVGNQVVTLKPCALVGKANGRAAPGFTGECHPDVYYDA